MSVELSSNFNGFNGLEAAVITNSSIESKEMNKRSQDSWSQDLVSVNVTTSSLTSETHNENEAAELNEDIIAHPQINSFHVSPTTDKETSGEVIDLVEEEQEEERHEEEFYQQSAHEEEWQDVDQEEFEQESFEGEDDIIPCVLIEHNNTLYPILDACRIVTDKPLDPEQAMSLYDPHELFDETFDLFIAHVKEYFSIENDVIIKCPQLNLIIPETSYEYTRELSLRTLQVYLDAVIFSKSEVEGTPLRLVVIQQENSLERQLAHLNLVVEMATTGGLASNPIEIEDSPDQESHTDDYHVDSNVYDLNFQESQHEETADLSGSPLDETIVPYEDDHEVDEGDEADVIIPPNSKRKELSDGEDNDDTLDHKKNRSS